MSRAAALDLALATLLAVSACGLFHHRGPVDEKPSPIDAFVRPRLDKLGLKPSPEADKITLLRRLSFDHPDPSRLPEYRKQLIPRWN